ncbi:MAG: transposase [Clostridia bacterium]|nr:transposase [Clostridia bacterium]
MARKESKVPTEITQYAPCKCCQYRPIEGSDSYRVYRIKSEKLPSGKWGTDGGTLIGKIIPGVGFEPNKRYLAELEEAEKTAFTDSVTDVEYGDYELLMSVSKDVSAKLNSYFGYERGAQIYSYGLILCAHGFVHVDQIDEYFQESILSVKYHNYGFKMGQTALHNLLHDLGSKGERAEMFEQSLIDNCSGPIAIDGHVIRSCSEKNDFAEIGYNVAEFKAAQINIMIAFDVITNYPIMYRSFCGSSPDEKSVIALLESRKFKNTKFLVEKGFHSQQVPDKMSENGNSYIIPLPNNDKNLQRVKETLAYSTGEFVYKSDSKDSARVVYYEEHIDEKTRLIVFRDENENNSSRKEYRRLMELKEESYTQERYDNECIWWGVYALQTNTDESAAEVFADYKARWSIETYMDYIRNNADIKHLKFRDYYEQRGFDFIMLITGILYEALNNAVKGLHKPSISTNDILLKAKHMRMCHEDGEWKLRNTRRLDLKLFEAMNFVPQLTYQTAKGGT